MAANGRLPASALTTVARGVQLANATAVAYRSMVQVAEFDGYSIRPAAGEGSGYRSLAMQQVFIAAANGDRDAAARVGLSTSSTANIAPVGYSSHGFGTAIDVVWAGSDRPTAEQLKLAARYGFRLTIKGDPNHLGHDGKTGIHGIRYFDRIRILGAYLNDRKLAGEKTVAEKVGLPDKAYWMRMQEAGRADGLYPAPYLIDGDPDRKDGKPSRTRWLETHYWQVIVNG